MPLTVYGFFGQYMGDWNYVFADLESLVLDSGRVERKASTSARVGMAACAPSRVVDSAATALAKRIAWMMSRPSPRARARPALKESPAAVVSTTRTRNPGTRSKRPACTR